MATIKDVAAAAGVSTATVSRVLNGDSRVGAAHAEAVKDAVARLGYRPNLVARSLRRRHSRLIALVFPDIENPFFTSVCRGVEDAARERGYSVTVANTDEEAEREARYLAALVDQNVAGLIIAPASAEATDIAPLRAQGIPVVTLDRALADATDSVHSDHRAGAREAVAHLVAGGSRRVACITGPADVTSAADRLAGYRDALAAAGLPLDAELVAHANYRDDGGYAATQRLLALSAPPDAIFAANNRMTMGALHALRDANVAVPDAVALAGFDDLPWGDYTSPGVTAVRQPTAQIGRVAAGLLFDRMDGLDSPPRDISLPTTLVVRETSVRPPSARP